MKACDWIARFLSDNGVEVVFELIGGMTTPLIDSIYRHGRSRIVTMHHEQAAAMAACGWAQMTRVPGVAIATSGPGAVNLLTGVGTAFFDSVPTVFLTGQVNSREISRGMNIRQLGFQETDIVSIAAPITKGARQAESAREIPELMKWAFGLAQEGRPGPVLIDLPMDFQREETEDAPFEIDAFEQAKPGKYAEEEQMEAFLGSLKKALEKADKPLFLLGSGVLRSGTTRQVSELVRRWRIPAVWSLMGKGALDTCNGLSVGMIGTYGNRWANRALSEADLLVVLGSRMDIRQTGSDLVSFLAGKQVFRVDVDEDELSGRFMPSEGLLSDLRLAISGFLKFSIPGERWGDWVQQIQRYRVLWPDTDEQEALGGINPNRLMKVISEHSARAEGFVVDVGAHQMWAAQSIVLKKGQFFMSSGGMGSMGYALPAAIGASIAKEGAPVVVLAGDGGFQCNIQELQTVVRNSLPLKLVLLDNRSLGMVRQFQDEVFEGRHPGTVLGYDAPDFEDVGRAYGIPTKAVSMESMFDEAMQWLWNDPLSPALLVASISPAAGVYPKMMFGKGLDQMTPEKKEPEGLVE